MEKKLARRFSLSVTHDEYAWIVKQAEWNHVTVSAYCRQQILRHYHPEQLQG